MQNLTYDSSPAIRRMEIFDSFPRSIRDWVNNCVPDVDVDDVRRSLIQNGPLKTLSLMRSWEREHIKKNLEAEKVARGL